MTDRLYYTDSYLTDFEAAVVDRGEGGRRVYLDRTAFYPTSGGQPFDTGRLNGVLVTDVVDEGARIAHLVAEPIVGDTVVGHVDWSRRFDHMQQHTGQHILSAVLVDMFGCPTVGVHFGRESSTLDLETSSFAADQVERAAQRANGIVVENRPVEVGFEHAGAVAGLRKASERSGMLRVVTIRDIDRSACGGTHVHATGEIGLISIQKVERVRKITRLEFLCGGRAIRRSRAEHQVLSEIAADFSSSMADLPRLLRSQREEIKEAQASLRELRSALHQCRARELYDSATPDSTGIRRVVFKEPGEPLDAVRGLAEAFTSLPMAIFVGTVDSPPSVILASSPDTRVDAAGVLKGLLAGAGGRGGGSARLAQGVLPGRGQLDGVVDAICGGPEGRK
jgi:alanyl-tRNA synthetase